MEVNYSNPAYLQNTEINSVFKMVGNGNFQTILSSLPEELFFPKFISTRMLAEKLMKKIITRRRFYFPVHENGQKNVYQYDFLGTDILQEVKPFDGEEIIETRSELFDYYIVLLGATC